MTTAPTTPPRRSTTAVIAALVPLLLGLYAGWSAYGLGLGSLGDPGPGLWPLAVSVILVASSVALLVVPDPLAVPEEFGHRALVALLGAATLVAYAYLFELVGFEIPTVLLLVVWLKFLGGEGWRLTAVVSVLATAAFYLVFITALGVSLPHLIAF